MRDFNYEIRDSLEKTEGKYKECRESNFLKMNVWSKMKIRMNEELMADSEGWCMFPC